MTNAEWMIKNGHKFSDLSCSVDSNNGDAVISLNGKSLGRVRCVSSFASLEVWLDREYKEQILDDDEMNDDLISRAEAIDALWKALYTYEDETERRFQESDELNVGDWIGHRIFVQNMNDIDRQTILNLPSAQPERKQGKWIERNPQNSDTCRLIECDQCGFSHIVGFNVPYEHWIENRNFCERCGADMREVVKND